MTDGPRLEVSRSHDGYVLISDAADAMGLKWKLTPASARLLAGMLSMDGMAGVPECSGTVETVGGTRIFFVWPRARALQAIDDLNRNAAAVMGTR